MNLNDIDISTPTGKLCFQALAELTSLKNTGPDEEIKFIEDRITEIQEKYPDYLNK